MIVDHDSWTGEFNIGGLINAGMTHMIHRISYAGLKYYTDTAAVEHLRQCKERGIPQSGYHVWCNGQTGKLQSDIFLSLLPFAPDFRTAIDFETNISDEGKTIFDMTEYINIVKAKTNKKIAVYINYNYIAKYPRLWAAIAPMTSLWISWPGSVVPVKCAPWTEVWLWQYLWKQPVFGVAASIDCNNLITGALD
jgi:hypothetical protein